MNKYELEQAIDKMEIVIKLLSGHIPQIYIKTTLDEAIEASSKMKIDLKEIKKIIEV